MNLKQHNIHAIYGSANQILSLYSPHDILSFIYIPIYLHIPGPNTSSYPNISSYPHISLYIPIVCIYPHSLLLKVTQSILMTWWTNAINQTPTWGIMNPVFPCNESNKNAEGVTQYSKGYFVWHEDSLPQFSLCANCVPWFLPFANTTREKYRKELPPCRYNYRSYSLPNISAQEFASFFISLSLTVSLGFSPRLWWQGSFFISVSLTVSLVFFT